MAVRTAYSRLVNINNDGLIVNKNRETIKNVISNISQDHRVFEYQNGSAPNAATNNSTTAPTIHEYLNLESSDGYKLVHLDQFFVITSND
jgi:hypothetical protein